MGARVLSSGLVAAAALGAPGPALAWPVDAAFDVVAGAERFARPGTLDWVEVEDPKVATAEVLESGELLLSGVAPGRTLALLHAEGQFVVWRLRVAAKGEKPKPVAGEAAMASARKACPGLEAKAGAGEAQLAGSIGDERCRQALLAVLETDAFLARELDLTFAMSALQGQLLSLQAGLAGVGLKRLNSRYLGAGLELGGRVSAAEHRKALWEVFRRSVGRVALDDQLEAAEEPPADAGTQSSMRETP